MSSSPSEPVSRFSPEQYTYSTLSRLMELAQEMGVPHAVICPGSRNAPIALAAIRSGMPHTVLPDERSAAYQAMGMSQALRAPVMLICTSGTAVLNMAPAVAEAFFLGIPLILITADRPAIALRQLDNQTILQRDVFASHAKYSGTWPEDFRQEDDRYLAGRILKEALVAAMSGKPGPAHINAPLPEPLYTLPTDALPQVAPMPPLHTEREKSGRAVCPPQIMKGKGLIVVGKQDYMSAQEREIADITAGLLPLFPDILSQIHSAEAIYAYELVLTASPHAHSEQARPDWFITIGDIHNSKTLREYLRGMPAETTHIHLGKEEYTPDTFRHLRLRVQTAEPWKTLHDWLPRLHAEKSYHAFWQREAYNLGRYTQRINTKISTPNDWPHGEMAAVHEIWRQIPPQATVHLGNSSIIRQMIRFPLPSFPKAGVFGNRGTSGIDGSLSTAAGHARAVPAIPHVAIVGDVAALYDSNALLRRHWTSLSNFIIVVVNNAGGNLFRQMSGPAAQPELNTYFAWEHGYTLENLAAHHHCLYYKAESLAELRDVLPDVMSGHKRRPVLLEVIIQPGSENIREATEFAARTTTS